MTGQSVSTPLEVKPLMVEIERSNVAIEAVRAESIGNANNSINKTLTAENLQRVLAPSLPNFTAQQALSSAKRITGWVAAAKRKWS